MIIKDSTIWLPIEEVDLLICNDANPNLPLTNMTEFWTEIARLHWLDQFAVRQDCESAPFGRAIGVGIR